VQALDLESASDLALGGIGPSQERGQLATAVPQIAICRTFWIYQAADVATSAAALDRTDSEALRPDSAARWPEALPLSFCRTDRVSCPRALGWAKAGVPTLGALANRELVPTTVYPERVIDPISVGRDNPISVGRGAQISVSPGVPISDNLDAPIWVNQDDLT
jgi:hypothetical protein